MDYMITTLRVLVLFSIPESMLLTCFALVWLGLKPAAYYRRILLFSFTYPTFIDAALMLLPKWLYIMYTMSSFFIFAKICFPKFKLKLRLLIFFISFAYSLVLESTIAFASSFFHGYETIKHGPVWILILLFWPPLLIGAAFTYYLAKKEPAPSKRLRQFLAHIRSKWYIWLIILIFLQISILMLIINGIYVEPDSVQTLKVLIYIAWAVFVIISALVFILIARSRKEAIRSTQEAYIGDLLKMFASIRGQRHDFVNHVQVMYSMLKMNKIEQLGQYMESVVKEIQSVNAVVENMPSPALAALVQAKTAIAQTKRIAFQYQIHDTASTFGAITDIDLVRMIGNLVDNAFDEVMKLPETEREVELELFVDSGWLHITVANQGSVLSDEEKEKIFTPGYSTKDKNSEHSGLGLANVMERANLYRGTVEVESDSERGVVFTVKLPLTKTAKAERSKMA